MLDSNSLTCTRPTAVWFRMILKLQLALITSHQFPLWQTEVQQKVTAEFVQRDPVSEMTYTVWSGTLNRPSG